MHVYHIQYITAIVALVVVVVTAAGDAIVVCIQYCMCSTCPGTYTDVCMFC